MNETYRLFVQFCFHRQRKPVTALPPKRLIRRRLLDIIQNASDDTLRDDEPSTLVAVFEKEYRCDAKLLSPLYLASDQTGHGVRGEKALIILLEYTIWMPPRLGICRSVRGVFRWFAHGCFKAQATK